MKKIKNTKLLVYAGSAFGPNLLMIFVTAYLLDAVFVDGLGTKTLGSWSIFGTTVVSASLIGILWTLAKVIDGFIDIPLSNFLENLRSKMGKRKLAILIGFIPMVISYFLVWWQPFYANSIANTWWIFGFLLIFFSSYTLALIAYYATFSEVTENEQERVKLSSYKAFFDVIGYSLAYALLPVFLNNSINIRDIVYIAMPLFLTMMIPFFILKEKPSDHTEERISLKAHLKVALKNKDFGKYLLVLLIIHLGLQLYLTSQNTLASGVLQLSTMQTALLNTAAFAPVPLMLVLFNYIQREKGLRYSYRSALLAFGVGIGLFFFASELFFPLETQVIFRLGIGILGGMIASFAIGPLFSFSYLMTSQLAADEMEKTGKNNASMYFAVQGLITQLATAFATGVIYVSIKKINFSNINLSVEGNNGIILVPFIVLTIMLIAFVVAKILPSSFEKENKVDLDLRKRKLPNMIVALIYSAGISSFFIPFFHLNEVNKKLNKPNKIWPHILMGVFTGGIYILFIYAIHNKNIKEVTHKNRLILMLILSLLGIGLFINPFIIQQDINQVLEEKDL